MLWNLDPAWLMMAIAIVLVASVIFGSVLDAIVHEDGFGPIGNMIVFAGGFFAAIFLVNSYGISLRDLTLATVTGIGGAFVCFLMLALLKAGAARLR
jgi:hypothetical protein